MLPGTAVSIVVNLGTSWASGRSLIGTELIPRVCVVGPITHQHFTRRFRAATGLSPKESATITRFQALVHTMLATDVAEWASIATTAGYYDQAHMINEFRALAGSSPTAFFRPHGEDVAVEVRGRPCEWLKAG